MSEVAISKKPFQLSDLTEENLGCVPDNELGQLLLQAQSENLAIPNKFVRLILEEINNRFYEKNQKILTLQVDFANFEIKKNKD